ncbi:DGQHR domain-containing protein [Neomoorella thermoacetica]|uniref:DGQHR domain-containing protein n=1 Tax=Neomoorella thermoacetica TaxID=1525 RepID=UPI0008FB7FAB|nr:DGQHR domain-containing protein [Moorella thermoacetica]APC08575.1 hypothetical protein MTJW_14160 [Moorella thermoacetica]
MIKKKKSSYSANLVSQGKFRFYIVSMPSEILGKTCFTITREEDPMEGFQRRLDENRAQDIANYIDNGMGSIPTAIILSAQKEAQMKYNSKTKTISFLPEKKAFLIIDGQHRVWGFIKAKKSIRVPVVIYENLTRQEEAQLFIDININQKQVPEALLLDVKRLLQNESEEEKRCSEVFDIFYTNSGSILNGHLARAEKIRGKISRITFNQSISGILNKDLRDLQPEESYNVINNYLKAIQKVFEEIAPNLKCAIFKPVIFQGLLEICQHVIDKTLYKHDKLTRDAFYDVLKVLKDNLPKQKILKPGKSYKKFSELVLEAITNVYIKPGIITED